MEGIWDDPPKKAGGWLLLFAITLLVVIPGMRLLGIVSSFGPVAAIASRYPRFTVIFAVVLALDVAMMVWSVAAGVALVRVRPYAVRLAKWFLIANPIVLFVSTIALTYSDLPAKANDAMNMDGAQQVSRTLFYTIVWSIYLHRSRRVKETFAPSTPSVRAPAAMPARKIASA